MEQPNDLPIDGDRVIAALEQQLGAAMGRIARLEAVIAGLLEDRQAQRAEDKPRVVSA
jgi:hypothetical protein